MSHLRSILARTALAGALLVGAATAAQAQTVLNRGNSGEPDTLDPHYASGTWENDIIGDLFMGLLTEAADGSAIPGAAESWVISDDGLVYTFNLRQGALWSDGQPVTADDFVFALRRILNPETAAEYAYILYPIKNAKALNGGEMQGMDNLGAVALDANTLEITLESPTPYFLELTTHYTSFPVPKHVVEEHGNDWVKPGTMVSNGAYMLTEWTPQTQVVAVKNPNFYDAANVAIDTVVYYPTEDRSAALRRFRAGELDLNTDFGSEQIDFLRENLPAETHIGPYLGSYYYPINHRLPEFQDIRVREAVSIAIDRQAITDVVMRTGELPADSFVPPMAGYEPAKAPWAGVAMEERIARAQQLMQEAGYGPDNHLQITLRYNTSDNHKRIAVAVADMWKQIYIDTELFNTDVAVHYNDLEAGDFQIARAGWIADYPDAQNFLALLQTSTGPQNYGAYSNAEFDKLMDEAAVTTDLAARAMILQHAEQISLDEFANIPIYIYVTKALVATYVDGWVDNSKQIHRTRWMSVQR